MKHHKKGAIITGSIVAAVGGGIWGFNKIKNREPKVISEFRDVLRTYIEAIRIGNMDSQTIDHLMIALEKLQAHKNYEKISIQLTTEELVVLVGQIYEYTLKLAEDNEIDLTEEELRPLDVDSTNTIIALQGCLKAQKRTFRVAA